MTLDAAGEYYIWSVAGKPFEIRLALDVVDRLGPEVMRGFGAVRRRGTEVGGLLLGSIEPDDSRVVVTIRDFELVSCEYSFGPSYALSAADLTRLRGALANFDPSVGRAVYTVGFFRSHTRDGLAPDGQDIQFFREYFPDPYHIALLVKPYATRASVAGFFFQEGGQLPTAQSYMEFPFRRRDLNQDSPQDRAQKQPQPTSDVAVSAATPTPAHVESGGAAATVAAAATAPLEFPVPASLPGYSEDGPAPRPWKVRLGWAAFSCMLVVFGLVLGMLYAGLLTPLTAYSASDPYSLALVAERSEANVLVRWDRQSNAIRNATRGVLTVDDGGATKTVPMDGAQLQNGTVLYRHVGPEITFKLEVYLRETRSIIETVVFRGESTQAALGRP